MKTPITIPLPALFLNACATSGTTNSLFQTLTPPNYRNCLDVACGEVTHSYHETNPDNWNWKKIKENERFKNVEKGFIAVSQIEVRVDELRNNTLKNI